jgi:hypothetical protein
MLPAILYALSIVENIRAYEVRDGGSIPPRRTSFRMRSANKKIQLVIEK